MIRVGARVRSEHGEEYVVEQHLADGGQGSAWAARVTRTGERAVVKTLACAGSEAARAASERTRSLIALRLHSLSPALAAAPRAMIPGPQPAHVCAFAPGVPLAEYIRTRFVERGLMLALATALARVVETLETNGLAHGDLSPGNAIIHELDGVPRLALIDFDGAVVPGGPPSSIIGTPLYSAPELLHGAAPPGILSDRFALGAIVCEILLGRHPAAPYLPAGAKTLTQARAFARDDWLRHDEHLRAGGLGVATISTALRRLLRQFLAVDPRLRPPARELRRALRRALDHVWICEACDIGVVDEPERGDECPHCRARIPTLQFALSDGRSVALTERHSTFVADVFGARGAQVALEVVRVGWEVRVRTRAEPVEMLRGGEWRPLPRAEWIEVRPGDHLRVGTDAFQRVR